jgi:preprotein translocase subunit SecG
MSTVLLIIHSLIALTLIGVVLLQRSEGGALGIGGGSGGFMTGRGAANFLTRVTAGLAAAFFATSLLLSIIATRGGPPRSILEAPPAGTQQPAAPGGVSKPSPLPPIDFNMPSAPSGQPPKDGAPELPKVPQSK